MYTVLGATGHIGSVITKRLLEKGEKVRVVGRNTARLQTFVQKGAEAFIGDVGDVESDDEGAAGCARGVFDVAAGHDFAGLPRGPGTGKHVLFRAQRGMRDYTTP